MLRQVKAQLIFDECSPDLQRVYFQQPLFQNTPQVVRLEYGSKSNDRFKQSKLSNFSDGGGVNARR